MMLYTGLGLLNTRSLNQRIWIFSLLCVALFSVRAILNILGIILSCCQNGCRTFLCGFNYLPKLNIISKFVVRVPTYLRILDTLNASCQMFSSVFGQRIFFLCSQDATTYVLIFYLQLYGTGKFQIPIYSYLNPLH